MDRVWQRNYANHAEAKLDVANDIVALYNRKRLRPALGNLPPRVCERTIAAKAPIVV
jgi:putative transposase